MGQSTGGGASSGGGGGGGSSAPKKTTRRRSVRGGGKTTMAQQKATTKANTGASAVRTATVNYRTDTPDKKRGTTVQKAVTPTPKPKATPAPAKSEIMAKATPTESKTKAVIAAPAPAEKATKTSAPAATSISGKAASSPTAVGGDIGMDRREAAYQKPATPAPSNVPPLIAAPSAANAPAAPALKDYSKAVIAQKPDPKPDLPVDTATYTARAAAVKEGAKDLSTTGITGALYNLAVQDKYRNDQMSYNQAYWAARKAGGATQAEMAAEQKAIGMKKAYSGDVVVTESMKREAAEGMKPVEGTFPELLTKGIRTTDVETSGLFGETTTKKMTYADGGVITRKTTDPVIKSPLGDVRLGDKTSTVYSNGIEQYTTTGDKTVAASPTTPAHISDTTAIEPMTGLNTVEDVQSAINQTTDPAKLAELHKRLRSLMRARRTQTQFGGLNISAADVEATKLGGLMKIIRGGK